jgi:hypothetical protein
LDNTANNPLVVADKYILIIEMTYGKVERLKVKTRKLKSILAKKL